MLTPATLRCDPVDQRVIFTGLLEHISMFGASFYQQSDGSTMWSCPTSGTWIEWRAVDGLTIRTQGPATGVLLLHRESPDARSVSISQR